VQVSRGKRQTTLPNAWWCAGIRRSARQQERDEAWALYSQNNRGTPKNEGFPTPSAPAASSDRVIGAQDHHHRLGSARLAGIRRDAGRGVYPPLYTSLQRTGLELDPIFQTILANGARLCEANFGILALYDDRKFRVADAQRTATRMPSSGGANR
jgi:hypothetical protein